MLATLGVAAMLLAAPSDRSSAASGDERSDTTRTTYHSVSVDGLSIFYREAGPKDAPVLLLLHGFPSSSRMYEPLFSRLSDRYRLIAPDYPGFGHSDAPDSKDFAYTFDRIAAVVEHVTQALGLSQYALFLQDYGGPVGFRLALAHPERVSALIVQNAVSHEEGLGPLWEPRRAYWRDRAANEERLRANLPMGEAPDWVRDAWIGLSLPLASKREHKWRSLGVLTGPHSWFAQLWATFSGRTFLVRGYMVNAKAAVDELAQHHPNAAAWWHENTPHMLTGRRYFAFDAAACEPET